MRYKSRWRDIPISATDHNESVPKIRKIPVKRTGFFSFCLACYGLAIEFISFIVKPEGYFVGRWFAALRPINLRILTETELKGINRYYYEAPNLLNIIFYLILLGSAIIYICRNGEEIRGLRFSLSILILTATIRILPFTAQLASFLFSADRKIDAEQAHIWLSGFVCLCAGLLSARVLMHINKRRANEIGGLQSGKFPGEEQIDATRGERLANFFIDSAMCTLTVCSLSVAFLEFIRDIISRGDFPGYVAYTGAISFCIIVYYLFFETLFGATPGKYVTESRVIKISGGPPRFKSSFIRTVVRLFPLDPFSFLRNKNWHDVSAKTRVVKEKRTSPTSPD